MDEQKEKQTKELLEVLEKALRSEAVERITITIKPNQKNEAVLKVQRWEIPTHRLYYIHRLQQSQEGGRHMEITVKVNYKNEKLQKLRQAAGLSQSQLAEAAGVNVRMYQKYEQGDRDISKAQLSTLLRICKALSCKLSDIVTDAETSELLAEYEK